MSQSLHLTCNDCKKSLLVGQSSLSAGGWMVYGSEDRLPALNAFVIAHLEHNVVFQDGDNLSFDYEDVTDYGED